MSISNADKCHALSQPEQACEGADDKRAISAPYERERAPNSARNLRLRRLAKASRGRQIVYGDTLAENTSDTAFVSPEVKLLADESNARNE
jgi:hypothetical protein